MDVDGPQLNGVSSAKRKGRSSATNGFSYREASDEEDDDAPLVRRARVTLESLR